MVGSPWAAPSKKSQGESWVIFPVGWDSDIDLKNREGKSSKISRICLIDSCVDGDQSSKIYWFWKIKVPHTIERGRALAMYDAS